MLAVIYSRFEQARIYEEALCRVSVQMVLCYFERSYYYSLTSHCNLTSYWIIYFPFTCFEFRDFFSFDTICVTVSESTLGSSSKGFLPSTSYE